MHTPCCDVVRTRVMLGIAIVANNPIIMATIMTSINVNPARFSSLVIFSPFSIAPMPIGPNRVSSPLMPPPTSKPFG